MTGETQPFTDLLSKIIDNRGRTCPTAANGTPLIATNCVKSTTLYPTYENVRYVTDHTMRSWFRGHPSPGDMLFVCKGSPGQVCLAPDPIDFCIAQDMVAIRADASKVYPPYLFAALRSSAVQDQIANMHVGTMIPHFKKGDFNKLRIPVPAVPAQIAIGDLYLDLSRKIELNRRMNATLEAGARALFRDWFVDFGPTRAKVEGRPAYLAPDVWSLFPDSIADDGAPAGWRWGTLADIARNANLKVEPKSIAPDTPYIGLEHMPRRSIALTAWEGAGKVSSAKSAFRTGQVLYGKLRPYFHKVGVAPVDGICSTDIVVLEATHAYEAARVLACVSTDDFVAYTEQGSSGTKMPRTNWSMMARYPLVRPDQKLAEGYQRLVGPMVDQIIANIMESRTLSETRDMLLAKLMSGEIRVRHARSLAEAPL